MNEKADSSSNPGGTRSGPSFAADAPTGLDLNPRPPNPVRVSKRAAGVLMAIAAAVLLLFAYGGYKRQQQQVAALAERNVLKNASPATAAGVDIAKDIPAGSLLNSRDPRDNRDPGALVAPSELDSGQYPNRALSNGGQVVVRQAPVSAPPNVVPAPQPREPSPEERRLLAAYEREQQAIAAPTTLREGFGSQNVGSLPSLGQSTRMNGEDAAQLAAILQALSRSTNGSSLSLANLRGVPATLTSATADGEDGDQNLQGRKESFLAKARAGQTDDYLKSTRTTPLSQYEIKAGWEIPAVLEQSLNSDLPGELKALVSSNVYDTATGRFVLIPQGSRLVGVYNARIGYGQDGVQVVWDRVIYPDGSSLDLAGMIGQDAQGYSGFRDKVDRHYHRLIGFAVLTSLFAAGSEISQNQTRSLLTYPSPAQVAGSAVGQQASELGAQITRRNLNVQPTIKVKAGYRFNVRVNRDILFDAPYAPLAMK